jgi:hypothetical protein
MRVKHLTLCVFLAGLVTGLLELRPVVAQAFSPRIEIGELQPGVKVYLLARNEETRSKASD